MFKSEEMQRIRAYVDKGATPELVEALYEFGAIHVTQTKPDYLKEYGKTLDTFKDISTALIALRSAEQTLKLKEKPQNLNAHLAELLKRCEKTKAYKANELNEEKERLKEQLGELEKKSGELAPPALFNLDGNALRVKSAGIALFQTSSNPQVIKTDFGKISNTAISIKQTGDAGYCLVVFDKTNEEFVSRAVSKHAGKIISIPAIDGSYASELQGVDKQVKETRNKISEINKQLDEIRKTNGREIVSLREALEIESRKAQLPFKFGATNSLIAVEAWIPKKHSTIIEKELSKKVKAHIEFLQTKELPPTKLVNPIMVGAFEELVRFFSLPKSTELDPTPLVAISFPLFFGMIVGDIGYGLVSLAAAIALKMKTSGKMMQSIGTMLVVSSISSIIFGVIFGEFFGFEHIFGFELHPLIHRTEEHGLALLMALSILFGMIHVAVGYLLGAYQSFKHNHVKHGLAKISWLILEFSLALYVAANLEVPFLHFIQPLAYIITPNISAPLIILSVIGIGVFEGATALFEIPGLLSNVFSYLRIMALGVSGAIIALILNKILDAISFATPVDIITSLLLLALFVLGHIGSIALALFESMIQSMRLQYVEFFSKFFEGGGIPFAPLNQKE